MLQKLAVGVLSAILQTAGRREGKNAKKTPTAGEIRAQQATQTSAVRVAVATDAKVAGAGALHERSQQRQSFTTRLAQCINCESECEIGHSCSGAFTSFLCFIMRSFRAGD